MKVTLIDVRNENASQIEFEKAQQWVKEKNPTAHIELFDLKSVVIRDCIGCWSCWWKTPGLCVHKDLAQEAYRSLINSNQVIFLFSTAQGFVDGRGKSFIDRLIQLVHPYIQNDGGESRHFKRYESFPECLFGIDDFALAEEERQVLMAYFSRTAYHFRSTASYIPLQNSTFSPRVLAHMPAMEEYPIEQNNLSVARKYVVYNGSPRGKKSNSSILIQQIVKGMSEQGVKDIVIRDLVEVKKHGQWAKESDIFTHQLFVFPLYVHAMPGIVMRYFELLKPQSDKKNTIGFLVQSGFPEPTQSYYLRPYLGILARRLNMNYLGTVIKPSIEGIQIMPPKMTAKLFAEMVSFGKYYGENGYLDESLKKQWGTQRKMKKSTLFIIKCLEKTGVIQFYWNMNLKKNGAYKQRFAKPFQNE